MTTLSSSPRARVGGPSSSTRRENLVQAVIRSAGAQVNLVVGPMVALIGVAALLAGVVLSIVLETAWFLMFLIPAAMGIGAGLLLLRGARRSRLQIDPEGVTWCGFAGAEQSLRWQEIHQLLPPPPASRRVVAIAQLRDGRQVEVRALWESPTSPAVLLGPSDHSRAQNALLGAHRAWLAGHR